MHNSQNGVTDQCVLLRYSYGEKKNNYVLTELISRTGARNTEGEAGQEDKEHSIENNIYDENRKHLLPPFASNVESHQRMLKQFKSIILYL